MNVTRKLVVGALLPLIVVLAACLVLQQVAGAGKALVLRSERSLASSYFTKYMNISPQQASSLVKAGVLFRVSKSTTLKGITGNLYYYGFIDDEEEFQQLLRTTEDTTAGDKYSIKVADNTIDTNSSYYLNYDLNEEEIADILLNQPQHEQNFSRYSYIFMPSKPNLVQPIKQ